MTVSRSAGTMVIVVSGSASRLTTAWTACLGLYETHCCIYLLLGVTFAKVEVIVDGLGCGRPVVERSLRPSSARLTVIIVVRTIKNNPQQSTRVTPSGGGGLWFDRCRWLGRSFFSFGRRRLSVLHRHGFRGDLQSIVVDISQ